MKKATIAKKSTRRTLGQQRTEWFKGISNRLSTRCNRNIAKIDKDITRVKADKDAVKALTTIKIALTQAAKALKA